MLLPTGLAQDEALRALSEIRTVVDKSTRYSTFSALSGFFAGTAAFLGSGCCGLLEHWPGVGPHTGLSFLITWIGVFSFAIAGLIILTWMKAQRRGERAWSPIARTVFQAALGPGMAGVLFTIALYLTQQMSLLPGLWLLLYGCGLYAVSFFAPLFLRWLGVGFWLLSILALLQPAASGLWLGLGFGGMHYIFGLIVMARYRR